MAQSRLNRELFCQKALQHYSKMGTNTDAEFVFEEENVKLLIESSTELTDREFVSKFDKEFGIPAKYANYISVRQQMIATKTSAIIISACAITSLAIAIAFIVKFIDLAKELHKIYYHML